MSHPLDEVFTWDKLKAWLKTKPADEGYDYYNTQSCALTQFVKDRGYTAMTAGSSFVVGFLTPGDTSTYTVFYLPVGFDDVALGYRGDEDRFTFGGMLRRAEEVSAQLIKS